MHGVSLPAAEPLRAHLSPLPWPAQGRDGAGGRAVEIAGLPRDKNQAATSRQAAQSYLLLCEAKQSRQIDDIQGAPQLHIAAR